MKQTKPSANKAKAMDMNSTSIQSENNWIDIAVDFAKEAFPSLKEYEQRAKTAANVVVDSMKKKPLYTTLGAVGLGILIGVAMTSKKKDH